MLEKLDYLYFKFPKIIQEIGINIYELKEWRLQRKKAFKENLLLLKKSENWSKEDIVRYQNKHLKKIVRYAYKNVPFYKNLYKENNIDITKIKNVSDLKKLPTVKKEDIREYWSHFISRDDPSGTIHYTSGTTGKPTVIKLSNNLVLLQKANAYRRDLWAGWNNDWRARFVGDKPLKNCEKYPLFRKSYVMKRAIFPSYCISIKTIPYFLNCLKKLNIKYIQAYPSTAYLLAKYLEMNDIYHQMNAVLYSSEPLYDFQRKTIEDRFQTKTYGYYAQAEDVATALECEKGNYHLTGIDGIMEIVKGGKDVDEGKKGFIIATSLHNFSMPLIRYELNDYSGYRKENCNCGRCSPLIYPVETKKEDFIITKKGNILSPSLLTFPLKQSNDIIESQLIQKNINKILIKIVVNKHFSKDDEKKLLKHSKN